ncbi:hypothetical protein AB0B30_38415 [Streptomyces narbonensis]|uniref:Uncharacterized protein n=1 Tax=Streptomyces narbonensis TaxID=67333 RepID=A0ABV3CMI7_9ACTN
MAHAQRLTTLRRVAEVSAITLFAVAALPVMAQAAGAERTGNSISTPLKVSGYGSTGYAYGTWKVYHSSNGTRSQLVSYSRLTNADDHKVYVELGTQVNTGYCYQASNMTCTQQYWDHASVETAHHSSKSYVYKSASTGVHNEAGYARGKVRAGLDVPWRPDPLTGWSYTDGGDKY